MFGTWASNLAFRPLLTALPQRRLAARWRYTAEFPPDQAIGGGTPSTLVANAGSQPQTAHACRTDDRPNSSAARCGSGLAQASSQSSTYSPSPVSQWAAAGDSVAVANPAGAGCAYAKKAARGYHPSPGHHPTSICWASPALRTMKSPDAGSAGRPENRLTAKSNERPRRSVGPARQPAHQSRPVLAAEASPPAAYSQVQRSVLQLGLGRS